MKKDEPIFMAEIRHPCDLCGERARLDQLHSSVRLPMLGQPLDCVCVDCLKLNLKSW